MKLFFKASSKLHKLINTSSSLNKENHNLWQWFGYPVLITRVAQSLAILLLHLLPSFYFIWEDISLT